MGLTITSISRRRIHRWWSRIGCSRSNVSSRVWLDIEVASGCEATQAACVRAWLAELGARVAWRTDAAGTVLAAFDAWERVPLGASSRRRVYRFSCCCSPRTSRMRRAAETWARASGRRSRAGRWRGAWRCFCGTSPRTRCCCRPRIKACSTMKMAVREQALRMLDDPRAHTGMLRFYRAAARVESRRGGDVGSGVLSARIAAYRE